MTDPEALDEAGRRLAAAASRLRGVLDGVVARHRPDVWRGGRADRFGRELEEQRLRLRAVAEDLDVEARLCHARADLARAAEALAP